MNANVWDNQNDIQINNTYSSDDMTAIYADN